MKYSKHGKAITASMKKMNGMGSMGGMKKEKDMSCKMKSGGKGKK